MLSQSHAPKECHSGRKTYPVFCEQWLSCLLPDPHHRNSPAECEQRKSSHGIIPHHCLGRSNSTSCRWSSGSASPLFVLRNRWYQWPRWSKECTSTAGSSVWLRCLSVLASPSHAAIAHGTVVKFSLWYCSDMLWYWVIGCDWYIWHTIELVELVELASSPGPRQLANVAQSFGTTRHLEKTGPQLMKCRVRRNRSIPYIVSFCLSSRCKWNFINCEHGLSVKNAVPYLNDITSNLKFLRSCLAAMAPLLQNQLRELQPLGSQIEKDVRPPHVSPIRPNCNGRLNMLEQSWTCPAWTGSHWLCDADGQNIQTLQSTSWWPPKS